MGIQEIHTYLVHPGKGSDAAPRIGGTTVQLNGKLFDLLHEIYLRSEVECDIAISFNRAPDGSQNNICRNLITNHVRACSLTSGRELANRLETVTTHRSGLGLLFLMTGREDGKHKLVISRFPADSAILAEEDQRNLSVEFLERVFMKSATAYKAALYRDTSLNAGFWIGSAVDRQINSRETSLSNYWIADFLDSDFRTTAAAGTRRLAVALRTAAKNSPNLDVKSEITAAVTLARTLAGRRLSIENFAEHFGLSEESRHALASQMKNPALLAERFQFDWEEFSSQVAFRSVELDSGALLTAESSEFDSVFNREVIDERRRRVRFSTEGRITNEKLGKSK